MHRWVSGSLEHTKNTECISHDCNIVSSRWKDGERCFNIWDKMLRGNCSLYGWFIGFRHPNAILVITEIVWYSNRLGRTRHYRGCHKCSWTPWSWYSLYLITFSRYHTWSYLYFQNTLSATAFQIATGLLTLYRKSMSITSQRNDQFTFLRLVGNWRWLGDFATLEKLSVTTSNRIPEAAHLQAGWDHRCQTQVSMQFLVHHWQDCPSVS